jgi:L-alanine-DL-glutamate epimerase-like enolase superfamily enzyme
MRISKIDIITARMPMKVPFRIAIGVTETSESLFIRIHTDDGHTGVGEANIFTPVVGETLETAQAAAGMLAQTLIGADPSDIEDRGRQMARALPFNPTTRSAFEIAMWDILGQSAGLPLFALLGGARRPIATDNTVGIDTPEVMAERAARFASRGFQVIKVKLGKDVTTDIERVRQIRAALGPAHTVRLDANQGWNRVDARRALEALQQFGPEFCEQPVAKWDIEGLAEIARTSPIPIMADESVFDEHDALRLVSARACHYLNIKLAKSGGIHTALKINAVGEAAGLPCMVGCMTESGIGLAAAVHLASARSNIVFADLDGADMLDVDPVLGGYRYSANGELTPATSPGLGVELDPDFVVRNQLVSIGR